MKPSIGFVDRPKYVLKTASVVDGERSAKVLAEQVQFALGKERNGDDARILGHCISIHASRVNALLSETCLGHVGRGR